MAVTTTKEFLAICRKSGLLTDEQMAETEKWTEQTDEPKRMAATLATREWVTRWQAHQLLNGRSTFSLGKYKLIDLLGRRGMGNVFLSRHTTMNRRVALKIVSQKIGRDPQLLKRFLDEARAIATLDHENIVRAYSVDKEGDCYYIVMEYVEGKDLEDIVQHGGPLENEMAAAYVQQAAAGLDHAHEKGLIHGHVKPSSLLVSDEGEIKITDVGMSEFTFGAKDDSGEQKQLEATAANYMAPELTGDDPQPDPRSDVYALGCTLYYLLTGQPPFPEGTALERMAKHREEDPVPILDLRPDASKNLAKVCRKMMAKNPEERFRSADVVQRVLAEVVQMEQSARLKSAKGAAPPPPRGAKAAAATAANGEDGNGEPAAKEKPKAAPKKKKAAAGAAGPVAKQPAGAEKAAPSPPKKKKKAGAPDFDFLGGSAGPAAEDAPAIQLGGKRKQAPAATPPPAPAKGRGKRAAAKAAAAATATPAAASNAEAPAPRVKKPSFFRRHKKLLLIGGAVAAGLLILGLAVPLVVWALGSSGDDDSTVAVDGTDNGGEQALPDDEGAVNRDDEGNIAGRDEEGSITGAPIEPATAPTDTPSEPTETEPPPGNDTTEEPAGGPPPDAPGSETEPGEETPEEPTPTDPAVPPEEPAEPTPPEKEPPEEETTPEEPKGPSKPKNPFRSFASNSTLLAVDAEGGDKPQQLAAIQMTPEGLWWVTLVGGDDIGKGKQLELQSNNEVGTKQKWALQLNTPAVGKKEATSQQIGNFWYEKGNLVYQWTQPSDELPEGALQSCLLQIRIDAEQGVQDRNLAFVQAQQVEPLAIVYGRKASPILKVEVAGLPNPDKLRFEVTRLAGTKTPIRTDPVGPVPLKTPVKVDLLLKDPFNNDVPAITYQMNCTAGRSNTVMITNRQVASLDQNAGIKFPLNEITRGQAETQLTTLQGEIKKRKGADGKELRGDDIAKRQEGVRIVGNVLKFDDLVKSMTDEVKLHYRVFVDLGQDRTGQPIQLDLLRTEAPEQAKPPAKKPAKPAAKPADGGKKPPARQGGGGNRGGGKKPAANKDGPKKPNAN